MASCGSEVNMALCGGVPVKFHPRKCFKFPEGNLGPEKMKGS